MIDNSGHLAKKRILILGLIRTETPRLLCRTGKWICEIHTVLRPTENTHSNLVDTFVPVAQVIHASVRTSIGGVLPVHLEPQ